MATNYFADPGTGGTWNVAATWRIGSTTGPVATNYPGELGAGDTVNLTSGSYTVTVNNNVPFTVTLTQTGATLDITTGGTLKLTGASSLSSPGLITVTGGTINNTGTLDVNAGADLRMSGGNINGGGPYNINRIGATNGRLQIQSGTNTLGNSIFTVDGRVEFNGGNLSIDDGTQVNILVGGTFDIATISAITTNGVSSPAINNQGLFVKTAGAFGTNVTVNLNNNGGTIRSNIDSLVLGGSPSHTNGTFNANGGEIVIGGNPTFNGTATWSGTSNITITGTPTIANSAIVNAQFVKMSSGFLKGPGAINFSNTVTFDGGLFDSALVATVNNTSNLNITGLGLASVTNNSHLINNGTITINPGVASHIDSGGHITNNAIGLIQLAGDISITSDFASSPRIDNAGQLTKSSGLGTATLTVPVNNTGTISSASGTLDLHGGGNHNGTFNTAVAGAKVAFGGGTQTFTGGTFTGSGGFKLFGGAMDVDAPIAITQPFDFAAGVLSGNANITFSALTWEGGIMNAAGGAGGTVLSGTATFTGQFGVMTLSGRPLTVNNSVTVNYTPASTNYLAIDSGANLSNFGTFNVNGDVPIVSDQLGGAVFNNNNTGNLVKNGGTGVSNIFCKVDNNGIVNVTNGEFSFNGGGTNASTINVPTVANNLIIGDKNYIFTTGAQNGVGNLGAIHVNGANAVLTINVPLALDNVDISNGKIVSSSGFTINKELYIRGGTLQGPGSFTMALSSVVDADTLLMPVFFDNTVFNNNGTFTYDGTTNALTLRNSASINNAGPGIFDTIGNGFLLSGAGTNKIQNAGILKKTAGNSGTRFDVIVDNLGGTISSEFGGGTIIINGGGSMTSGTITTTVAGALVHFFGGTFNVSGGTFTGTGKIGIVGGIVNVNANVNATTTLQVDSGTLDVSSPNTFQITTLEWNGGTLQGAGTKRVFGGSISAVSPTSLAGTGTLTLAGTSFSYDADNVNFLTLGGSSTFNIESGATMTITGNGIFNGATPAKLSSTGGTLAKSGGATARVNAPIDFTAGSGGAINVSGGILELNGGGTVAGSSGNIQLGGGTELRVIGGTLNLNASATLSGSGSFRINGGTVNVNTPVTFANLLFDSGVLSGTANVGLDGGKWVGGNMNGSGTTKVNIGKTFEIATGTPKFLRRPFTNDGTVVMQNLSTSITFENGITFTNNSLVELQMNSNFFCTCTPTPSRFWNKPGANLQQFNAAGTSNFLTVMDNDGTVTTTTGILNMLNGGTHTGAFVANANTFLSFQGTTTSFSPAVNVSGTGAVGYRSTSTSFAGTHALTGNGLTIIEGGTTFTSASTISTPSLEIRSGSIGGTSNVAITGGGLNASNWQAGTVTGSGSFTLANSENMDFSASTGAITLDGRTFTNNGTIGFTSAGNPLNLANNASITNNGTFDIQSDAPINVGPGANTFVNGGTFEKVSGAGTTTFQPAFTNSNLVNLFSGTVSFVGGFTQVGGTTTLNGGNLTSPLTINLNAGSLKGNGTITGNVSNAGNVIPGLSPGGITITGDYAQGATGALNVEIGGTTPVSGYDQLNVTGTATLGGTLNAVLFGGFTPANGDTFDVLTYASSIGTFATVNTPTFPGGGSFTTSQQQTRYRLTAITTSPQTDLQITKTGPATVAPGGTISYNIVVKNNGPLDATNVIVNDPTPAHATFLGTSPNCNNAFPCNLGTLTSGQTQTITATYEASSSRSNEGRTIGNIASVSSDLADSNSSNNSSRANTTIDCANAAPDRLSPSGGATAPASGNLNWRGTGSTYVIFLGPAGSGCTTQFGTTDAESLPYSNLTPGTYEWRVASDRGACARETSSCVTFKVEGACQRPETPVARVVGQQTSGKTYAVEWDPVPGAVRYEIDEAPNASFIGATTTSLQGTSQTFNHTVETATGFFYRVRAFIDCTNEPSAYSLTVRVVIVPLPPQDRRGRNVNIPAGSRELVVQQVFIPGVPNESLFFTATTDRPWLSVHPSSGPLPPFGITLDVTANPADLPNGTFTASVIVAITPTSTSSITTNGTTTVSVPVSINLVTPVSPVPVKEATSQYAMIVPSIGHLDGINSFWQSDVRITNAGFKSYRYKLTFTPTGGAAAGVKQTTITVDAGATTALDDIVRNWYGFGALGDNAAGMLEILPIDEPAAASAATVASSRTYNITDNSGTLGQFIPAVRFNNFIGSALNGALPSILSLQQIAESAAFRTNLGVAEGSGNPASLTLSVFNSAGSKLLSLPLQLAAGEQRQLNSFLASNNISLTDGRIEVQVAGGTGKVTAYASVIDNNTRDPLLVSGTLLAQSGATKYVLPGVANIDNPVAHWRTDMRVFNYGASVLPATLTFFPIGGGTPQALNVSLTPGAVLTLDDVLASKFSAVNTGGVVHLTTGSSSSLVVTGRTYNQTSVGTFGQFIPAVTPEEAVGNGGPTLHILQVEDSSRYRTNIGLAEVGGQPVTVEVQVVLPDLKFTPTVQIPLAANEFRQFSLIRDLNLGAVYNGRVTVRVIGGNGRVTAYGSVIDELTQDPTYVPAQK